MQRILFGALAVLTLFVEIITKQDKKINLQFFLYI